jgi:hypothetical protein
MDVRKYLKSGRKFIKKHDLQQEGPRTVTIAAVEECAGFDTKNGEPPPLELQLVFTDETRLSLRTAENMRRLVSWFGLDDEKWVGRTVEVYFSPDVPNPRGGAPGGVRLQLPTRPPAVPFKSDLEYVDETTGEDVPFTGES